MAVEIGALRALLSLDSAAFETGVKRAQASMGRLQRSLQNASRAMQRTGQMMTTRMTAPIVAATGLLVRSSLQTIDAQAKMAQSLDTSVASLQVLARAADMAGLSQGDLEGALTRMTRRVSLAAQGMGPGVAAFERLGLAAEDLADIDADERIRLIQERLVEFIPAAERAGVLSQIFGDRVGVAMSRLDAPTIAAATQQVNRFGVAVSDVDADAIEEANDAISAVGLAVRGLANQMTVALAPTLQAIAEGIQDLSEWFTGLSPRMQRVATALGAIAAAAGPVLLVLGGIAGALALVNPAIVAIAAVAAAAGVAMAAFSTDASGVKGALDAAKEGQVALNAAMGTFYETAAPSSARAAIEAANANYQLAESAVAAAEAEVAKRQAELRQAGGGRSDRGVARQRAAAAQLDLERARAAIEQAERARDRAARAVTGVASTFSSEVSEAASGLTVTVEGLADGLGDLPGAAVDVDATLRGAGGGARDLGEAIADLPDTSALDPIEQGVDSISSAMARAVTQGENMGEALGRVFEQIAQDILSSRITEFLAGALDASGLGDLLGGADSGGGGAGSGGGGSSSFAGFFDRGGMIPAGKVGIAGEYGPEFVRGPAVVTSRRETAAMLSGAGTQRVEVALVGGGLTLTDDGRIMAEVGAQVVQGAQATEAKIRADVRDGRGLAKDLGRTTTARTRLAQR